MSTAAVRDWWKAITPQRRRAIMLFTIVVTLFGLANVFKRERPVVKKRVQEAEMSVVTPARKEEGLSDLRTRVEALSSNLDATRLRNAELEKKLSQVAEGNREADNRVTQEVMKEVGQLKQDMTLLRNSAFDPKAPPTDKALSDLPPPVDPPKAPENRRQRLSVSGETRPDAAAAPTEITVAGNKITLSKADAAPAQKSPQLSTTAQNVQKAEAQMPTQAAPTSAQKSAQQFIPAGTIIQGVTLNGVDAPTSGTAQRDSVPILLRIKKEAILPSRYTQDLRECFIILAVYGVMSSERVKGRTEMISCTRSDGGVIESKLDGFIVDVDGREGIKGTLVSKQGAVIARGLLAGFVSGFGSLATPTLGSSLTLNSSTQQMLSPDLSGAANAGAIRGVSQAANDYAKFFLETAKEMHPVIEVPSGIEATVILLKGVSLAIDAGTVQRKEPWQNWFK